MHIDDASILFRWFNGAKGTTFVSPKLKGDSPPTKPKPVKRQITHKWFPCSQAPKPSLTNLYTPRRTTCDPHLFMVLVSHRCTGYWYSQHRDHFHSRLAAAFTSSTFSMSTPSSTSMSQMLSRTMTGQSGKSQYLAFSPLSCASPTCRLIVTI